MELRYIKQRLPAKGIRPDFKTSWASHYKQISEYCLDAPDFMPTGSQNNTMQMLWREPLKPQGHLSPKE